MQIRIFTLGQESDRTMVKYIKKHNNLFVSLSRFASILICIFFNTIYPDLVGKSETSDFVLQLTDGFCWKQIIWCVIVWLVGYGFLLEITPNKKTLLAVMAFPTGEAVIVLCLMILLFLGIPTNSIILKILVGLLLVIVLTLAFCKKKVSLGTFLRSLAMAISAINLISTGIFPILLSSDSYSSIYDYGTLLANRGAIDYALVGEMLVWTGISPAVMQMQAVLMGFDFIYIIHWLLMLSLFAAFSVFVLEKLRYLDIDPQKQRLILSISVVCLLLSMPMLFLSTYVISNAYFMVYAFFFVIGFVSLEDKRWWIVLSIFLSFICLNRSDGCITMCFFLIALSMTEEFARIIKIATLPVIVDIIYFLKDYYLYRKYSEVYYTWPAFLNDKMMLVMVGISILTYGYIFVGSKLYKSNTMTFFAIYIVLLGATSYLLVDNFSITLSNLNNAIHSLLVPEWWGYVPILIVFLTVILFIYKRWDRVSFTVTYGYVFLNFLTCSMRENDRIYVGYGDTFNRVMFSVYPIFFYIIVTKVLELLYIKKMDQ